MDICKGHPGIGDEVSGRALVASDNFSARYDLDRIKGVFSRPQHKLYSQSYDGKILVLNVAKGGVATAWMLKEMVSRGVAPKAIILNFANPIMAQGAAFANLSLIDRFDIDITEFVPDGAKVKVTPETGEVWIL
jgi:predicted aconitase with swiveling domain